MNCTVFTFLPQKEGAVSVQSDNPALNNKYNNKYNDILITVQQSFFC